jgi:pyroglutamyl-peptidase
MRRLLLGVSHNLNQPRKKHIKHRNPNAAPKTVLLTAFEPFGGQRVNASKLAAEGLDGRVIRGYRVVVVILPCAFGEAIAVLKRSIRRVQPDLVIAAGEAGGRAAITLERVAINVDDATIDDNAGARPVDRAIADAGPVGYWSTLPIKAIVSALKRRRIPAAVSQTAGTFVCNHVFYGLMRILARRRGLRAGFVHVPYAPGQAPRETPTMPTTIARKALEVVIATSIATRRDARISGGATQ